MSREMEGHCVHCGKVSEDRYCCLDCYVGSGGAASYRPTRMLYREVTETVSPHPVCDFGQGDRIETYWVNTLTNEKCDNVYNNHLIYSDGVAVE